MDLSVKNSRIEKTLVWLWYGSGDKEKDIFKRHLWAKNDQDIIYFVHGVKDESTWKQR